MEGNKSEVDSAGENGPKTIVLRGRRRITGIKHGKGARCRDGDGVQKPAGPRPRASVQGEGRVQRKETPGAVTTLLRELCPFYPGSGVIAVNVRKTQLVQGPC